MGPTIYQTFGAGLACIAVLLVLGIFIYIACVELADIGGYEQRKIDGYLNSYEAWIDCYDLAPDAWIADQPFTLYDVWEKRTPAQEARYNILHARYEVVLAKQKAEKEAGITSFNTLQYARDLR